MPKIKVLLDINIFKTMEISIYIRNKVARIRRLKKRYTKDKARLSERIKLIFRCNF